MNLVTKCKKTYKIIFLSNDRPLIKSVPYNQMTASFSSHVHMTRMYRRYKDYFYYNPTKSLKHMGLNLKLYYFRSLKHAT